MRYVGIKPVALPVVSVVLLLGAFGRFAENAAPPEDDDLRGVFVEDIRPVARDKVVGRMAVRLQRQDGSWQRVSAEHPFRSGDMFRFEVESNHDGRLVILHRSSGEEDFEELWPDDSGQEPRLVARQARVAPDGEKTFTFDEEVGREHFYVAIATQALAPKGEIKNFVLRSVREKQIHTRSTRATYPGDQWLYFAPSEQDNGYLAVLELRLRHEPADGD